MCPLKMLTHPERDVFLGPGPGQPFAALEPQSLIVVVHRLQGESAAPQARVLFAGAPDAQHVPVLPFLVLELGPLLQMHDGGMRAVHGLPLHHFQVDIQLCVLLDSAVVNAQQLLVVVEPGHFDVQLQKQFGDGVRGLVLRLGGYCMLCSGVFMTLLVSQ